jgi:hypothetical protein
MCLMCRKKGSDMIYIGKHNIPFHKECFKCKECGEQIPREAQFVAKKNDIYMTSCYQKLLSSK